jgi:glycerophosphoryl diester phosphodiesterase
MLVRALAAVLALAMPAVALAGQVDSHSAAILDRFEHANLWRDHVMVVGHRGGVRQNGQVVRPENSIEAIEAAIALGLEMVELDVQKTADGVYVVLHDSWLDRTTTCKGELLRRSLAELASCRLLRGEGGEASAETPPTLKDALRAANGRILVNIDNKLEPADLAGMIAVARKLGMQEQVIVKQNLFNDERVAIAHDLVSSLGQGARFMPIVADDAINDPAFVETASHATAADAVELINWRRQAGPMTETGGPLFSPKARAAAIRGDWHLWVNTYAIVNKPAGYLSGGRGDELATVAANPDDVYGFWVERGATIIQTDEPKAAIEWLEKNGYRRPYATRPVEPEQTASIN